MSVSSPEQTVVLGNPVTLTTLTEVGGAPTADPTLSLSVLAPDGTENTYDSATSPAVSTGTGTGNYFLTFIPDTIGEWRWRWVGGASAQGASEGVFLVISDYVKPNSPVDLTDLRVMVPRARRYIEGPYGPPENRPPLLDSTIYALVADAVGDIILFSGSVFGHQLIVKSRDPTVGYPTAWKTEAVLDEWEVSVITSQTALNYFFFVFRDLKTSESIKNEGTEWQYAISVNIIRDYLAELQSRRDLALQGLRSHHPVIDRYASNIRVRDQATVAILEWWATNTPDATPGLPGGQEAAVIPWTPGWSGPGFTP